MHYHQCDALLSISYRATIWRHC